MQLIDVCLSEARLSGMAISATEPLLTRGLLTRDANQQMKNVQCPMINDLFMQLIDVCLSEARLSGMAISATEPLLTRGLLTRDANQQMKMSNVQYQMIFSCN